MTGAPTLGGQTWAGVAALDAACARACRGSAKTVPERFVPQCVEACGFERHGIVGGRA
jgi:hypothetical protein